MPKRTDGLENLKLTLELLKRIRKDRSVTAAELRQKLIDTDTKFTRELRSIQRLLENLSVERDESSKPYRYRWKPDAKGLSLPGLSPQEALLLTLAEQQLGHLLPARLMKSMEGFFNQARGQLDEASGYANDAAIRQSRATQLERE